MTAPTAMLETLLDGMDRLAVAVSGGVDSLTLAVLSHRRLGRDRVLMAHAISPAVPPEATARVTEAATREGWRLDVIDAGEFHDPEYRRNPVNRCFFCKINLYAAIAARTRWPMVSGANLDDLGEYRPGLEAARQHHVRHPYVEVGLGKADVRHLARGLGLAAIAELPASPCLSSRVETGIPIEAETLTLVHGVERLAGDLLHPRTVRCRVRAEGLVLELDAATLARISPGEARSLQSRIAHLAAGSPLGERSVRFALYKTGSAFLVDRP